MYSNFSEHPRGGSELPGEDGDGSTFCLSVAFDERTAHDGLHVVKYFCTEGRTACSHQPNASSEAFPDLREDELIIKGMGVIARLLQVTHFGADSIINQAFLHSGFSLEFGLDVLYNPTEYPGDGDEDGDFDGLAIFLQFQWVSA